MVTANDNERPHRVMLARVAGPGIRPRFGDMRPMLVRASSERDAVELACRRAVLEGLAVKGTPGTPLEVRIIELDAVGSASFPAGHRWSAELVWSSSGRPLCHAAGTVERYEEGLPC